MCVESCAKFILYFVNLIFVLIGAFLAVLGGLGIWNIDTFLSILRIVPQLGDMIRLLEDTGGLDLIKNSSIAFLVIGGVLFVIGFLGCCGAKGDYKILLVAFTIILGVLLAAEIALIIYVVVDRNGIQTRLEENLNNTIANNYAGEGLRFNNAGGVVLGQDLGLAAWDALHMTVRCCGSTSYRDWQALADNWNNNFTNVPTIPSGSATVLNAMVPLSCCKVDIEWTWPPDLVEDFQFANAESCLRVADDNSTFHDGCVGAVFEAIDRQTTIVYAVLGAIMGLQLLEIILACCLIQKSESVV